jgi:hypothetical protein
MANQHVQLNRRTLTRISLTFGAGTAFGAVVKNVSGWDRAASAASTTVADPTATREAELAELHALQTEVARPQECTPAVPTPTPTATLVPLSQTGEPLAYGEAWTVTVLGINPAIIPDGSQPTGKFMQVNLELSHSAREAQIFPYADLILTDSTGKFSLVSQGASRAFQGNSWLSAIVPGTTELRSMIFDVAADAGDSFILESNADPTFRVAMTVEQRG